MPKCSLANRESRERQIENPQTTRDPRLSRSSYPRTLPAFFAGQQPQQVGKDPLPAAPPLQLSPAGTDALHILRIITHSLFSLGKNPTVVH